MPILDLQDLPALLSGEQRLLGLDLGDTTIGMAISDPALMVASPIDTIRRRKFTHDAGELARTIRTRNVGALVLGLPVNMDGSHGPRVDKTRSFADNLLKHPHLFGDADLPIAYWDERLSTSAVERFLIDDADMTRKRRGEVVDKMAAGWILQGALDWLSSRPKD
ncbi:MAG: Holliday junction resolvase RuvX [Alphaproteobacteria bacterium]